MNTVADIRAYLEPFDDDELMCFALVHKSDKKYLERSIDNNVAIMLEHPVVRLHAIIGGMTGENPKEMIQTIFLTND